MTEKIKKIRDISPQTQPPAHRAYHMAYAPVGERKGKMDFHFCIRESNWIAVTGWI